MSEHADAIRRRLAEILNGVDGARVEVSGIGRLPFRPDRRQPDEQPITRGPTTEYLAHIRVPASARIDPERLAVKVERSFEGEPGIGGGATARLDSPDFDDADDPVAFALHFFVTEAEWPTDPA